jgi:hypothetical protein
MVPFVLLTDVVWIPAFISSWLQLAADDAGRPPPPTIRELAAAVAETAANDWGDSTANGNPSPDGF